MNPTYKQQWIDALRSGTYQQANGRLRFASAFCCLGVLTDLVRQEHGGEWRPVSGADYHRDYFVFSRGGQDESYCLPGWVGELTDVARGDAGQLSSMNDTGESFAEIADYIQEHL